MCEKCKIIEQAKKNGGALSFEATFTLYAESSMNLGRTVLESAGYSDEDKTAACEKAERAFKLISDLGSEEGWTTAEVVFAGLTAAAAVCKAMAAMDGADESFAAFNVERVVTNNQPNGQSEPDLSKIPKDPKGWN